MWGVECGDCGVWTVVITGTDCGDCGVWSVVLVMTSNFYRLIMVIAMASKIKAAVVCNLSGTKTAVFS